MMTATCVLLFITGLAIALLAHRPMKEFLALLRRASNFKDPRPKRGVPSIITGTFERLLAFILLVICVDDAFTVLGIWLGLKLAANWQAMPHEDTATSREVSVGTLTAVMAGIISVGIGAFGGWLARWGCGFCQ
jgi:hypothetical protein